MDITEASVIVEQNKQGLQYQRQMGFTEKWPEYEKFKAGDQWAPVTEKTKNLPRPVFNIIDYIENHKIASVMNENIKMIFSAQEISDENLSEKIDPMTEDPLQKALDGAEKFTKFSDTTWEEIKQDELNEELLESGSNLGTGILHYYWDNSITSGIKTKAIGQMQGESIDPINIFFGNPQCRKAQKQPWISITVRDMVENVKEEAKQNGTPTEQIDIIQGDKETKEEGYDAAQQEINYGEKCTVITQYKREKDGYIYLSKVCGNAVVMPWTNTQMKVYPIAVLNWKPRKKCIFGIGDTEGLVPNQKGINFLLGMMLMSAQQTAWPKLLVRSGALKQQITNTPGEIITDVSTVPGDNIKYMASGTFSPATFQLVDKFVDLTKQLSAAQDASTGDMSSGNLNASAIMLLQKAAGVPIESIKKRFYRCMEDVGRIWEEFYRVKYNLPRSVKFKDENGKEYPDTFDGSQYADIGMGLKIDIGPTSSYSESLMMASLDKLYDKRDISLELYLKYAPKNVIPFKDRLLKDIEAQRMQQQQQVAQAQNSESDMHSYIDSLSPEEQAMLEKDPQLQNEILKQFGGGGNVMPNMPVNAANRQQPVQQPQGQ